MHYYEITINSGSRCQIFIFLFDLYSIFAHLIFFSLLCSRRWRVPRGTSSVWRWEQRELQSDSTARQHKPSGNDGRPKEPVRPTSVRPRPPIRDRPIRAVTSPCVSSLQPRRQEEVPTGLGRHPHVCPLRRRLRRPRTRPQTWPPRRRPPSSWGWDSS